MSRKILAFDLATRTGFAVGAPGERPLSGSLRFAKPGAPHEELFGNAFARVSEMIRQHKPDLVAWEAPLPTSFKKGGTNVNTTTILFGLPAIVGAAAYGLQVRDLRKERVVEVRKHFIGSNPKRIIAKKQTIAQCATLGWNVSDDNEADALALWHFVASLIDPDFALTSTPLFKAK